MRVAPDSVAGFGQGSRGFEAVGRQEGSLFRPGVRFPSGWVVRQLSRQADVGAVGSMRGPEPKRKAVGGTDAR